MVVQLQEHLVCVLERRLIQEFKVVPGGSRLWEEMGFSSILSAMFRVWTKGGRHDEMGVSLLLHTCIRFSSSISPTTLLPLQAHTIVCLPSIRCIHICVCMPYVSTYRHLLTCVNQAGVPPHTKSHRHTVALDHTSPHVVMQTGHTDTQTTDRHTHIHTVRKRKHPI